MPSNDVMTPNAQFRHAATHLGRPPHRTKGRSEASGAPIPYFSATLSSRLGIALDFPFWVSSRHYGWQTAAFVSGRPNRAGLGDADGRRRVFRAWKAPHDALLRRLAALCPGLCRFRTATRRARRLREPTGPTRMAMRAGGAIAASAPWISAHLRAPWPGLMTAAG